MASSVPRSRIGPSHAPPLTVARWHGVETAPARQWSMHAAETTAGTPVITKNKKWQSDQEFEELSDHSQSLAGFEAFVTTLEQRYQLSLKGADETQPS